MLCSPAIALWGVDVTYAASDEHPHAEPDEWGDLQSFREATAAP
jgi:hypothetical protein